MCPHEFHVILEEMEEPQRDGLAYTITHGWYKAEPGYEFIFSDKRSFSFPLFPIYWYSSETENSSIWCNMNNGWKRASDSTELQLKMVETLQLGAQNWTQFLFKSIQCSELLSHFSSVETFISTVILSSVKGIF